MKRLFRKSTFVLTFAFASLFISNSSQACFGHYYISEATYRSFGHIMDLVNNCGSCYHVIITVIPSGDEAPYTLPVLYGVGC